MSHFSRFESFVFLHPDISGVAPGTYVLQRHLGWDIGQKDSPWFLLMVAGNRFDLSVPRWLHWLISPHDRQLLPAAAVHDELLRKGFDRPFAAAEFRRAARARGVGHWKAWALFFAVLAWTSRPGWMRSTAPPKDLSDGNGDTP